MTTSTGKQKVQSQNGVIPASSTSKMDSVILQCVINVRVVRTSRASFLSAQETGMCYPVLLSATLARCLFEPIIQSSKFYFPEPEGIWNTRKKRCEKSQCKHIPPLDKPQHEMIWKMFRVSVFFRPIRSLINLQQKPFLK